MKKVIWGTSLFFLFGGCSLFENEAVQQKIEAGRAAGEKITAEGKEKIQEISDQTDQVLEEINKKAEAAREAVQKIDEANKAVQGVLVPSE